jgi:hypothetical protein
MVTDVSELLPVSVITACRADDGGSKHLRYIVKLVRDYTAQHFGRHSLYVGYFNG